jgi:hypothetical protein
MYSIVIPFLSNSTTIAMCLDFIKKNSLYEHEIVSIVDEADVYYAYNKGVYKSKYDTVVLMNDDMIVSENWDKIIPLCRDDTIYTGYVIEKKPGLMTGGPMAIECDCGDEFNFDYEKFKNFTKLHSQSTKIIEPNSLGWYMPAIVNQKTFVSYPNIQKFPQPNDVNLFLNILPFVGFKFAQIQSYFYHFSGVSRKKVYE